MLVSYKWLQEYVDINVDPQTLGEKLTMAGICVDLVTEPWKDIYNIKCGKIKSIDKHPDADKLVVCHIYMGPDYKDFLDENGLLQIVTGAKNVKAGDTVPVAIHGSAVAGGKIKKSKLRGVPSYGMLCSKDELLIEKNPDDEDGIWILPDEIEAGTDIIKEFMLDDAVLDIDLTPNRSDCLSIINVAREVSAVLGTDLHLPQAEITETAEKVEDLAKITVIDQDLCPRYTGRVIKNIKKGQSPYWMQHYLQTAGLRPISNVVDVSNFVMLEMGQPLHTFDYDKLDNHEIIVRRAKAGEEIVTLDEIERKLPAETLLICDAEKPVCVAGVMGGLNSEITAETKNILLESAVFNHVSIRHTGKNLGLHSEAALRYEKGVDITKCCDVAKRATQLLCDICGGEAVSGIIDTLDHEIPERKVIMRPARVNHVLGTDFKAEDMVRVLKALKFELHQIEDDPVYGTTYEIPVPSFRADITEEVDMVEEVVRMLGFDHVPVHLPYGEMTEGKLTAGQKFNDDIINSVVGLGANQILTYSFMNPKEWDKMHLSADDTLRQNVEIMNPLNEDQKVMRTSLIPGMLKVTAKNHSRRNNDLLLFEKASVYIPTDGDLPQEDTCLGIIATGKGSDNWLGEGEEYDFFYIKGLWEALAAKFGVKWSVKPINDILYLHPGRAAEIFADGETIGFLGEIHPLVAKEYDLNNKATVMQINLDKMFTHIKHLPVYESLTKFPASTRDIAFTVKKDISVGDIEDVIRAEGGKYLTDVYLFDVYEGVQIGKENKSLAYSMTFLCRERTITDDEVNAAFQNILDNLESKFDAKLR
ncbi:MAG: phenylalanine--tRNA ligase subunit beta [Bacillota bacterium]|jgi:phenylalanyl-tRNA synthetase beta chain